MLNQMYLVNNVHLHLNIIKTNNSLKHVVPKTNIEPKLTLYIPTKYFGPQVYAIGPQW